MTVLALLRVIFYLYVGIECLLISYLYREGSLRYNPNSKIILFLQRIFFLLGIQFVFMAFIPLLLEIDPKAHYIVINFLVFPLFGLGYLLSKFRTESTKKKC